MFMLERFRQTLNIISDDIKQYFNRYNKYLLPLLLFFLFLVVFLFLFDASPNWVNNLSLPLGNDINNLEPLFFSGHFLYLFNFLILLKFEIISFLYSSINTLF